jgi:hypothetical protein
MSAEYFLTNITGILGDPSNSVSKVTVFYWLDDHGSTGRTLSLVLHIKQKQSHNTYGCTRGRECTAPPYSRPQHYMGVNGQCHAPAALYPRKRAPGTHCTRGWVGSRAGLDMKVRGKILLPLPGIEPRSVRSQTLY